LIFSQNERTVGGLLSRFGENLQPCFSLNHVAPNRRRTERGISYTMVAPSACRERCKPNHRIKL
jgi:hypothetical protein